jgi:hypothetical protein
VEAQKIKWSQIDFNYDSNVVVLAKTIFLVALLLFIIFKPDSNFNVYGNAC